MAGLNLSDGQRRQVAQAVTDAEAGTDGEIVTIVTAKSDAYHDVALHYALGAMLVVAAIASLWPEILEAKAEWVGGDWGSADLHLMFFLLMAGQAIAFLIVRYALTWDRARMALTPTRTKARRVRRRALQFFRASAEQRTRARVGILLYLSLDEHMAEIVADAAIHAVVPQERWGDAMAVLVDRMKAGDPAGGMAGAVARIGAVLAEHFPKTEDDVNELPDRLIEL